MPNQSSFVNIHTHQSSNETGTICIVNVYDNFEAIPNYKIISIGLHPWFIHTQNTDEALKIISQKAINKNVLAIGECGLDKLIDTPLQVQEQLFIEQIKIAEKVKKPLIIHCVKAFDDLIRIKKELKISVPIIVHGFNNKKEIAEQLLKNNFYISFGRALLNHDSNASFVIKIVPIDKIFLETDDAEISIKRIFETASKHKQISTEELKQKIFMNFKSVFKHE